MNNETLIEVFGYIGSALVVVSMLMASVVKLRIINTIGSVISATYAFIIGSFPLALMNICLIVINLYNLRKLSLTKKHYDLVPCSPDDAFVGYFLSHHQEDISRYFPSFQEDIAPADTGYLVFCNGENAGILLAKRLEKGHLCVSVEYTTPAYRDCSIGKFLYSALPDHAVHTLEVKEAEQSYLSYLKKMGYCLVGDTFVKHL